MVEKREKPQFDLVCLATFIDFEKRRLEWREKYPSAVHKSMDAILERVFEDPKLSYIEALDEAAKKEGVFEGQKLPEVLQDLECYLKGKDRVDLIKAVRESPIHIFGSSIDTIGWKEYFANKPNIKVHPSVNYPQAIQIMKMSKILLNPSLKNKEGAHERIFTALACGALVITNESQYLQEHFVEGKDIVYYRHPLLEEIQEAISTYLSDESRRTEMVKNGCKKIAEGETWDHRVTTLEKELPPLLQSITKRFL